MIIMKLRMTFLDGGNDDNANDGDDVDGDDDSDCNDDDNYIKVRCTINSAKTVVHKLCEKCIQNKSDLRSTFVVLYKADVSPNTQWLTHIAKIYHAENTHAR